MHLDMLVSRTVALLWKCIQILTLTLDVGVFSPCGWKQSINKVFKKKRRELHCCIEDLISG